MLLSDEERTVVANQGSSQRIGRSHELEDNLEDSLRSEHSRHLLRGNQQEGHSSGSRADRQARSVAPDATLMSTPACTMTVS